MLADDDKSAVSTERPGGLRVKLGFEHAREAMIAIKAALIDRLLANCEQEGHWLHEFGERLLQLIERVEAGGGSRSSAERTDARGPGGEAPGPH